MIFMVFESNPFAISPSALVQESAVGLNPLLYDLHMVWHPPLLYLGQVLTFPLFLKSLSARKIEKNTVFLPLFVLTMAIATGSLWAFTQLGWGGFWFWDPVETLSVLPWFLLLIIVHLPRQYLENRTEIYQLPFLSVIFSAWLIRSGTISSVHSFAESYATFWFMGSLFLGTFCIYILTYFRRSRKNLFNISFKYQLAIFVFASTVAILLFGIFQGLWTANGLKETFYHQLLAPLWILGSGFLLYMSFISLYRQQNKFNTMIFLTILLLEILLLYFIYFKDLDLIYGILGVTSACNGLLQLLMIRNKTLSRIAHAGLSSLLLGLSFHSNSLNEQSISLTLNQKEKVNEYDFLWNKIIFEKSKFVDTRHMFIQMCYKDKRVTLNPQQLFFHTSNQQRYHADYKRVGMGVVMITEFKFDKQNDQKIVIKIHHKYGLLWIVLGIFFILLSVILRLIYWKTKNIA